MPGNKELRTAKNALIQKIQTQINKLHMTRTMNEAYKIQLLSEAITLLTKVGTKEIINQAIIPEKERNNYKNSNTFRLIKEADRLLSMENSTKNLNFDQDDLIRRLENKIGELRYHNKPSDNVKIEMLKDALRLLQNKENIVPENQAADTVARKVNFFKVNIVRKNQAANTVASEVKFFAESKDPFRCMTLKEYEIRSQDSNYPNSKTNKLMNEVRNMVKFQQELQGIPAALLRATQRVEERTQKLNLKRQSIVADGQNGKPRVEEDTISETTAETDFSLVDSDDKQQLIDEITRQIAEVATHAGDKYYDKYAILSMAKRVLKGESKIDELSFMMAGRTLYKDALVFSQTKSLVARTLNMFGIQQESPAPSRPGSLSSNL